MSALDIALIAILALPAVAGLWKGLANIVTALVGIWAAFLLAPLAKRLLAGPLERGLGSPELAAVVAYGVGFVVTLLVVGLLGLIVTRSLKKLDLQWANRLAGAGLGLLCGLLLGGVLVAALEAVAPASPSLVASRLAPPLGTATRFLVALGPEIPAPGLPPAPPEEPLSAPEAAVD